MKDPVGVSSFFARKLVGMMTRQEDESTEGTSACNKKDNWDIMRRSYITCG